MIAVNQSSAALELLSDTLTSKRTRSLSIENLETIVLRLIELAVDLNKPKVIRDGLYHYKKLTQATSISSLEFAFKKFIQLSEDKVSQAQDKADKITLDVDEDLEAARSPEDILLSTVSSEQSKDRTDREVVTPWLKLLWEAYRLSLDSLRSNSKLEVLYHTVVNQAFDFCIKYNRKTEFRRLCEILRLHLSNAAQAKNSTSHNPIDLSDPETLQRFLDARFRQLNVAVELELWQEAFRSVEDVHNLFSHSKIPTKPIMMANYYENLARIFLVSDNYLFHATSWSRYWSLLVQSRNVREEELVRVASSFLISTLAIPTFPQSQLRGSHDDGDQRHRNSRLTNLLNLSKNPTRDALLKQALSKNVLNHVRPEIKSLYSILEVDFHPLSIKSRIVPIIAKIAAYPEYKPYFKPLYDVILTRLFQQLSQVYETVKFDFVIDLATFPSPFNSTPVAIEKFIVRGCHKGEFNITIDHESGSIAFKDDIYDESTVNSSIAESASSLQLTPSEIVRTQLSRLGSTLFTVINKVDSAYVEERAQLRKEAIDRAVKGINEENIETLERLRVIEERQKAAQAELLKREEEEAKARRQKMQEEREAELQRIAEENARRELERKKKEEATIREQEKRRIAEDINSKGIISIDMEKIDDMNADEIKALQVQKLSKVSQDLRQKLETLGRRMDHAERAIRYEEIPKWKEDASKQLEADKKFHEARYVTLIATSKKDYEVKLALKKRLSRLLPNYQALKDEVYSQREEEFEKIKKENAEKLEHEKQKRIAEFKARRKRERERELERQAEESRRTLEKNKRIREEEERRVRLQAEEESAAAAAAAAAAAPSATPSGASRTGGAGAGTGSGAVKPGVYVPPSMRGSAGRGGVSRNVSGPPSSTPAATGNVYRRPPPSERRTVSSAVPSSVAGNGGNSGTPAPRTPSTTGVPGKYNPLDAIRRRRETEGRK